MLAVYAKFSALLDRLLAPAEDILIVAFAAVFMMLAQIFGIMP